MQVFECLQSRELSVTVLSDSSVADYKTADYLSSSSAPFLRSLHTSALSDRPVCQSLEQPNIVTGLPAAGTLFHFLNRNVSGVKKYIFFCRTLDTARTQTAAQLASPSSVTAASTRRGGFLSRVDCSFRLQV